MILLSQHRPVLLSVSGIDGVPFVINPKLSKSKELKHFTLNSSSMTLEELENLVSTVNSAAIWER